MKKNFLELIGDTEDRVFPLNYKYVDIKEMPQDVKDKKCLEIDLYQTSQFEPGRYHKPISKVF
ncbi:MAG: hypothetical protein ACEPOV_05260 [Hyphomicrobiales bacterium]